MSIFYEDEFSHEIPERASSLNSSVWGVIGYLANFGRRTMNFTEANGGGNAPLRERIPTWNGRRSACPSNFRWSAVGG